MAKELQAQTFVNSGSVFARLWDGTDQYWNGASFEAFNASNIATYSIAATQDGTTGKWTAPRPALADGLYQYAFFQGVGAEADPCISTVGESRVGAEDVNNVLGSVAGDVLGDVAGDVLGSVASVVATVGANIVKVNGITVDGSGTQAAPWGPV